MDADNAMANSYAIHAICRAVGLVPGLVLVACTIPNPAFDPTDTGETSTGTGDVSATTVPAGASTSGAPDDSQPADTGSTGDTDNDSDADSGSDESSACSDQVDDAAYGRCFADDDCAPSGLCSLEPAPGPVVYDLSVCEPGCADDCDCPMPSQGSAEPLCEFGRCTLACEDDDQCQPGMSCVEGRCLWSNAYDQCNDTCPSGCFQWHPNGTGAPPTGRLCPAVGCLEGPGAPNVDLCPLPATGNATPVCFADNGWCVLSCSNGEVCPEGTQCLGNEWCYYPV